MFDRRNGRLLAPYAGDQRRRVAADERPRARLVMGRLFVGQIVTAATIMESLQQLIQGPHLPT